MTITVEQANDIRERYNALMKKTCFKWTFTEPPQQIGYALAIIAHVRYPTGMRLEKIDMLFPVSPEFKVLAWAEIDQQEIEKVGRVGIGYAGIK